MLMPADELIHDGGLSSSSSSAPAPPDAPLRVRCVGLSDHRTPVQSNIENSAPASATRNGGPFITPFPHTQHPHLFSAQTLHYPSVGALYDSTSISPMAPHVTLSAPPCLYTFDAMLLASAPPVPLQPSAPAMFEPTAPGPPISWNPALANAFMYRMPMPNIPNPDILPLPLSRPPLETASEPSLPAAVPDDVSMKPQPVDFPSLPSLSLRTKRPAVRGRDERAASMVVPPSVPLPPLPLSTAGASHAGNATPGSLPEMSGLEQQIKENELKGAKKHKAALFELIETEKRYISDLRLAESLFSYRIQCLGSRDVVDKIFGDMPRIAQVNTRMYLDLLRCLGPLSALIETERDGAVSADTAARCASEKDGDVAEAPEAQPEDATRWPEDRIIDHLRAVRIGATLSKHIKGFTELYSQYKTDLGNAKIYLKHIADESLKWSSRNNPQRELYQGVLKAIKEAEKDPRARRLEFQDFLILPMQRLTKYPLLLQTLFKHTPEAHPDYKAIFSALGVALKVAKDVDRS